MLIDWLTFRIPVSFADPEALKAWHGRLGWIMAVDADGNVEWRTPQREVVRSDSHQIVIQPFGDCVQVSGSPCRVDQKDNVFGSPDILECVQKMRRFADTHTGLGLSDAPYSAVKVTRIDVTKNFDMGGAVECRQALMHLRHAEGGRRQVRTSSESVYWSPEGQLRRGKAYHKGPQLRKHCWKGHSDVSDVRVALADRLLRLELQLCSKWINERAPGVLRDHGFIESLRWWEMTSAVLSCEFDSFFRPLIGSCEVVTMDDILPRLEAVCDSRGKALAAFRTWSLIKALGAQTASESMPRSTWHRHRKALFDAGLSWADFQAGNVVPIRRKPLVLADAVASWGDLEKRAA